eukprot:5172389-Amphidinium_carterae.2
MKSSWPWAMPTRREASVPHLPVKEVLRASKWNNPALAAKTRRIDSALVDVELWQQIEQERDQGWLMGPWTTSKEMQIAMNSLVVCSRRFSLVQGEKVRPIDDVSESQVTQVNASFAVAEKLGLMGLDVTAALISKLHSALVVEKQFKYKLDDGKILEGDHACKQWAIDRESRKYTGMMAFCPGPYSEAPRPVNLALSMTITAYKS